MPEEEGKNESEEMLSDVRATVCSRIAALLFPQLLSVTTPSVCVRVCICPGVFVSIPINPDIHS